MGAPGISPTPRSFPGGLAQGVVDAVLPAGAALLEVVEHVAVDAQGHRFLGVRDRRFLGGKLGRLGGHGLERRFGGITRAARAAWSVWRHDRHLGCGYVRQWSGRIGRTSAGLRGAKRNVAAVAERRMAGLLAAA